MGFPSSNSIINLADLVFTIFICFCIYLLVRVVNLLANKCTKIKIKSAKILQEFKFNAIIRLLLESYLSIMLSALINLDAIIFKGNL